MACQYAQTTIIKHTRDKVIIGCDYLKRRFHMEEDPCISCILNPEAITEEELTLCTISDEIEYG
jgi:hypothetical protein